MSLKSRKALVAAGVAALAVSGASATQAQAAFQKTLQYSCIYPYVDAQPLTTDITADIPATFPAKTATPAFGLSAVAVAKGNTAVALETVGAASLEGSVKAGARIDATNQQLPLTVPLKLPKQNAVIDSNRFITLNASGSTPSIRFLNEGPAKIYVEDLALTLIAYDETGGVIPLDPESTTVPQTDTDPNTFQVSCTRAPASQDNLLATVQVTGTGSTTTPTPTPTPVDPGTPTPTPTATPSTPTPTPTRTPTPTPTPTTGPSTPTPTPGPDTNFIDYKYTLAGSATLKTLTKGSLPLSGGISARLGLPSGNFTGDLTLNETQGNLTALGFLPVTAKVNLIPTDKINGSLRQGKLIANAKVRIKLPSVKTFGIELAGGANCQAKQISAITLTSTQATFLPLSGGPIAGTFSISDLSGCGFLTGIVSPLTSGSGNAIALNLTPSK